MKINRKKRFIKAYKKLDWKIQNKFIETLWSFINDPFDKELNNHSLKWKYKWLRSINVTWDYRAVFKELSNW